VHKRSRQKSVIHFGIYNNNFGEDDVEKRPGRKYGNSSQLATGRWHETSPASRIRCPLRPVCRLFQSEFE